MRFSMCVHAHQPPGNFDSVFHRAVEQSYAPFFELLEAMPAIRLSVHLSGSLLEWLERNDRRLVGRIRRLVARGQVELMTAGLYEPVLALIPPHDRANQLLAHRAYLRRLFGVDTDVGWLTERVWEPTLAEDLAHGGVAVLPLDDHHFLGAGIPLAELTGPFTTEYLGARLTVVPALEEMRAALPWKSVEEALDAVRAHAANGTPLLTFADDVEKFGLWPGTYSKVFGQRWLERFFAGLAAMRDEVEVIPLGEAVRAQPPARRVYLPGGSYPEMLRWSMPPSGQRELLEVQRQLESAGLLARVKPMLRTGVYFQYLAKYPEVNYLHKRMLDVSRRVAARHRTAEVARSPEALPEAVRELWRAQANCAYWHGWFGGSYLPHLRQTLWRSLLRAERALEADGERRQPLRVFDLDADGRDEVLLTNDALVACVAPADGGALVELSDRVRAVNLVDTLARRPEAYHGEGAAAPYPYDRGRRACFVDRFLDPGAPPARRAEVDDRGGFAGEPYEMTVRGTPDGARVTLHREAAAPGGDVRVAKTLHFPKQGASMRADYHLTGLTGAVDARFGVELNFALFFAEHPAGTVEMGGRSFDLMRGGAARDVEAFDITSEEPALRVRVETTRPAHVDARPLATVSQSDTGYERIIQSLSCLLTWPVALAPGERFDVAITVRVAGLGRRGRAR